MMNNWTGFSSGKPKDLRTKVSFTKEYDLMIKIHDSRLVILNRYYEVR